MSFVAVAAGIGAGTGLLKVGMGLRQNRLADRVTVPEAEYRTSPYAKAMLEDARQLMGARMPGADQVERGISGAQGNTLSSIGRNASSGAQALAMLAATQGQSNAAIGGMRQAQQQFFMQMLDNMNRANRGMILEGDKVYQSDMRNREMAMNEKNALRGAATQNFGGGLNDLTNYAFLASQLRDGPGRNDIIKDLPLH